MTEARGMKDHEQMLVFVETEERASFRQLVS